MPLITEFVLIKTHGYNEIVNITTDIENFVEKHCVDNAILNVSVIGSTASITNIEFESGLISDFNDVFNNFIPVYKTYKHNKMWDEDNAYAYLRAAVLGNSRTFAVYKGELQTGTWQQIVLIDFDNKPRVRKLVLQLLS